LPSGWKIGSRLKQLLRLPRAEVLAVAGAAVLALVISLAVIVSAAEGRARRAAAQAAQAAQEAARTKKKPVLTMEELALGAEDFILPPLDRPEKKLEYMPFRPRLKRWSAELAAKYWVAPRDVAAEVVRAINDRRMQRLFQDVP
jgi:type II secretory pathway pseudopilin PulG